MDLVYYKNSEKNQYIPDLLVPHCELFKLPYNIVFPRKIFSVDKYPKTFVCYPDKSAYKKLSPLFDGFSYFYADKVRDQLTSRITKFDFNFNDQEEEILNSKRIIIADDLCDGGATFKICADSLKNTGFTGKLNLFIVHGIFSGNAPQILEESFDNVYCTNSYPFYNNFSNLNILDIWN